MFLGRGQKARPSARSLSVALDAKGGYMKDTKSNEKITWKRFAYKLLIMLLVFIVTQHSVAPVTKKFGMFSSSVSFVYFNSAYIGLFLSAYLLIVLPWVIFGKLLPSDNKFTFLYILYKSLNISIVILAIFVFFLWYGNMRMG